MYVHHETAYLMCIYVRTYTLTDVINIKCFNVATGSLMRCEVDVTILQIRFCNSSVANSLSGGDPILDSTQCNHTCTLE